LRKHVAKNYIANYNAQEQQPKPTENLANPIYKPVNPARHCIVLQHEQIFLLVQIVAWHRQSIVVNASGHIISPRLPKSHKYCPAIAYLQGSTKITSVDLHLVEIAW
jgi:hypothetical protein